MKQDIFNLDGGPASLTWPESMTPEEYEDFRDWLVICLKKVERIAVKRRGVECPGCGSVHENGHHDTCACDHCTDPLAPPPPPQEED